MLAGRVFETAALGWRNTFQIIAYALEGKILRTTGSVYETSFINDKNIFAPHLLK